MNLTDNGYHITLGCMRSGKTFKLLRDVDQLRHYSNCRFLVVRFLGSEREHDQGKLLQSRSPGSPVASPAYSKLSEITQEDRKQVDVFFIDEAQFFPDLKEFVHDIVINRRKTVHAYGLNSDFRQKPWPSITESLPFATKIENLHSVCSKVGCNRQAIFTIHKNEASKKNSVDVDIEIGDLQYEVVCTKCLGEWTRYVNSCKSNHSILGLKWKKRPSPDANNHHKTPPGSPLDSN